MASINTNIDPKGSNEPDNLRSNQPSRESCIQLLNQWLADESGYDEENWPKIKTIIEQNRTSNRPLFSE